jgi:hypothetical protein
MTAWIRLPLLSALGHQRRLVLVAMASVLLLSGCMLSPLFQAPAAVMTGIAVLLGLAACGGGGGGGGGTTETPPGPSHWPALVDLGVLTSQSGLGIVLNGGSPGGFDDYAGRSLAIGDVNGDGIGDLLIGAPSYHYANTPGRAFLLFGGSSGITGLAASSTSFSLDSLSGSAGFIISGTKNYFGAGQAVAIADVNGDGIKDLIVVEGEYDSYAYGIYGWTVFGGSSLSGPINLSMGVSAPSLLTDGSRGVAVYTYGGDSSLADGVVGAVDLDGDGFAGIVLAVPSYGYVDVIWPTAMTQHVNGYVDATVLPAADHFLFYEYNTGVGAALATLDLNGDGIPDLAMGAPTWSGTQGAVVVLFGSSGAAATAFPTAATNVYGSNIFTGSEGFVMNQSVPGTMGTFLAAGDINGDGKADLVIGAPVSTGAHEVLVLFGRSASGWTSGVFSTSDLGASDAFRVVLPAGEMPYAVATADVNGDGATDLIIGVPYGTTYNASTGYTYNTGKVYVIFGGSALTGVSQLDLGATPLTGSNGFLAIGPSDVDYTYMGKSFAIGDVNGDGIPDIAIGASYSNYYSSTLYSFVYNGQVFVIFGLAPGATFPSYTPPQ